MILHSIAFIPHKLYISKFSCATRKVGSKRYDSEKTKAIAAATLPFLPFENEYQHFVNNYFQYFFNVFLSLNEP